ncbi:MAG: DUF4112 domain-containing protein [Phycisphaerales bacterium]
MEPATDRAQPQPPPDPRHEAIFARADRIATLLDAQFVIPGTNIRFGYDGLLGIIPGIGDTITAGIGFYIVWLAIQAGARKRVLAKMAVNLGIDWLVGLIPLLDILFDVAFKANLRNVKLLRKELGRDGV